MPPTLVFLLKIWLIGCFFFFFFLFWCSYMYILRFFFYFYDKWHWHQIYSSLEFVTGNLLCFFHGVTFPLILCDPPHIATVCALEGADTSSKIYELTSISNDLHLGQGYIGVCCGADCSGTWHQIWAHTVAPYVEECRTIYMVIDDKSYWISMTAVPLCPQQCLYAMSMTWSWVRQWYWAELSVCT